MFSSSATAFAATWLLLVFGVCVCVFVVCHVALLCWWFECWCVCLLYPYIYNSFRCFPFPGGYLERYYRLFCRWKIILHNCCEHICIILSASGGHSSSCLCVANFKASLFINVFRITQMTGNWGNILIPNKCYKSSGFHWIFHFCFQFRNRREYL